MSSAPDNPFQSPEAPVDIDTTLTALQQKLRETPLTFVELGSLSWWALREQLVTFAVILIAFHAPISARTQLPDLVLIVAKTGFSSVEIVLAIFLTAMYLNRHYTRRYL